MPNPIPATRHSFEDSVDTLLDELLLATKWDRPSLLLAVHRSKFGQAKAARALEERLSAQGLTVIHILVDEAHSDVPHLLAARPDARQSIFFIFNLDWGSGADRKDAFRALNIYREIFIDQHLKTVFWLTTNEAAGLPHHAPDFWAFRHRVIEFSGQRVPRKIMLPAGALLWNIQNAVDPLDTLDARIAVREELLGRLPHSAEARSARVDLLYNLGYLHWMKADAEKAAEQLRAGLELEAGQAAAARTPLLNGLAVIAYEARQTERAEELLRQAVRLSPDDAYLVANLAATLSALGRNYDANAELSKAVKLAARDPRTWCAAGYIHAGMGKFDEAIQDLEKAAGLAPRSVECHAAAAICYALVERTDDCAHHMELARQAARGGERNRLDLYSAIVAGDMDKAAELAAAAITDGQLQPQELRRDPNLSLLLEPEQLEHILA